MHEVIQQALGYVRVTWRHRWWILLLAWPICLGGWAYVHQLPDQYEASARIYVDTRSVLKPLLRDLSVDTNVNTQVQLMTRTLLSRPNLERLTRMTDLDLRATSEEEMDQLLQRLRHTIELSGSGRQNLYTVSYTNKDPQLAKRVVQSLVTIFVEDTLGESRKDTDQAQRFLDKQIKEYEAKLEAAEKRLKEFKRQNVGRMPSEGKDYYDRLQQALGELERARLQLSEAKNRRDELQRQLSGEEPTFGVATPTSGGQQSELDKRISRLQERLDQLKLQYTDKHPDVQAVQRTLEDLEEQRRAQRQAAEATGAQLNPESNPIYSRLKVSLSEVEGEVASLQARVNEYENRVERLRQMVDIIPQVEAELKKLNRDYEVHKQNYEKLLARREQAKMAEDVEQQSDSVQFRVVDPPHVPSEPSGPNRGLFHTAVLFGGIGAGLAFAFFVGQVRPTFDNRRSLVEATGLPVYGGISMAWTPAQRKRKRLGLLVFSLFVGLLIVAYGVVIAISVMGVDVGATISQLTGGIL